MRKVLFVLVVLLLVVVIGGAVYLAVRDVPPKITTMEVDVPSSRLSP